LTKKVLEEINLEIINPIKALLDFHKEHQKQAQSSLHNADLQFYEMKDELEKLKIKYLSAYKTFDDSVEAYDSMIGKVKVNSEKQRKLNQKLTQLFAGCKEAEKKYMIFAYSAREKRVDYIDAVGAILNGYQKLEEERINSFKEKLEVYYKKLVMLGDQIKEITEDVYNKSLVKLSVEEEIPKIIKIHKSETHGIDQIDFVQAPIKHEDIVKKFNSLYVNENNYFITNKEELKIPVSDFNLEEIDKTAQLCKSILDDYWNSIEVSPERLSEFKEIIKSARGRKHFCEALSNFRVKGIFTIPKKTYSHIANLLNFVLDETDKDYDINNTLQILILSQTYYTKFEKDNFLEKIYLQQSIQEHPLWKKTTFWEKAIGMTTDADGSIAISYKETEKEKRAREQSMIFGRLGTFGYNMLQFGISKETCEKIIFEYAERVKLDESMMPSLRVRV